jgi:AcrR family transcriptional regulator
MRRPHAVEEAETPTRERIKEVALELFLAQGYEQTSLRQISERLGFSKAALYYHFHTKEAILEAVFGDVVESVRELVERCRTRPHTPEARRQTLTELAALVRGRLAPLVQFSQENQPALRNLQAAGQDFGTTTLSMFGMFDDPEASLADQLRFRLAIVAIYLGHVRFLDPPNATPEDLSRAAVSVAFELAGGGPGS